MCLHDGRDGVFRLYKGIKTKLSVFVLTIDVGQALQIYSCMQLYCSRSGNAMYASGNYSCKCNAMQLHGAQFKNPRADRNFLLES